MAWGMRHEAWGMRGSKDSNMADENDESAHRFWRKLQKKLLSAIMA